jgi:methylamine---glutamate N-methyltransferase subunit C
MGGSEERCRASISRYPLEGYREHCATDVTLGTRFAKKPIELNIPITIAGMSFGALSAHAKEALGRAATAVGTSTTTGDGGMTPEERKASRLLVYQCLPSRYGFNLDDLRAADAIEVVIGQGAKPGGGGMLLGQKVSERVAAMRTLPPGIDQRSASRHPDWTGPDDLRIKIEELREATGWEKPVYVKLGATRVDHDVKLAVAAGADVVVVDGMQGGTGATQTVFIEHAGIPTLPAVRIAAEALREIGKRDEVQLIVSGGIRSGADVAKALALGADAVSIGVGALIALGCNRPTYRDGGTGADHDASADYTALGTAPGYCHHCHTGMCPVGVTTQDPDLERRLDPEVGARWMTNYLKALTMELTALARACGKSNVHHLEPDDLVALTVEAAAMAKVPLAGTDWVPGSGGRHLPAPRRGPFTVHCGKGRCDVRQGAGGRGSLRGFRARARRGA